MRRLVENVLDQVTALADHKGLVLALHYIDSRPHLVDGDAERLRRLLLGVVRHAVESTERGHVLVTTRRHPVEDESAVRFAFEVRSTNSGMTEEVRAELLRDGAPLASAREQAAELGGALTVGEAPGETTLSFTLPVALAPPHMKSTQPILRLELENRRILVVDAHPLDRLVLRETLEHWRFRVTESATEPSALSTLAAAAAEGDAFAIAVLAHPLPQGDMLSLCRRIKGNPALHDTVLLAVGQAGTRPSAEAVRSAGCSAFITKPVHQSELMNGIVDAWAEASAPDPAPAPTPAPQSQSQSQSQARPRSAKEFGDEDLLVLIVEDNIVNQKVAQHMLIELGCRVHVANNGSVALEKTLTVAYDLVFMDIQMPVMDGLEATRALRERDADLGSRLPIVAMTAHAKPDDRQRCFDAGMDGYITKPVRQKDLRQAVVEFVLEPGIPTDVKSRPTPSSGMDIDTSLPCDLAWLKNNYNTDDQVLRSLVRMFLDRAAVLIAQMRDAVDTGDMKALGHHAHALKGISGTVRANPLFVLMVEDPPVIAETIDTIEETFTTLHEFLHRELNF